MFSDAARLRALAAAATLASGAVMMGAGYLGSEGCLVWAGLTTIPGGVLILAAFAVAGRADRVETGAGVQAGHTVPRLGVLAMTLVSGAIMVFAGVAASQWGWLAAVPAAIAGGIVIAAAFASERRGVYAESS